MPSLPAISVPMIDELKGLNLRAEALLSSNPREALAYATQALEAARAQRISETVPTSLWAQGCALHLLAQMDESDVSLAEASRLAEELGQAEVHFRCINALGANAHRRGEYGKAFSQYQQSLSYARAAHDQNGEARVLGNIAILYDEMGQAARALQLKREVLAIGIALETPLRCVIMANNIAEGLLGQGEFEAALEIIRRWRPVAQNEGFEFPDTLLLANQGWAKLGLGQREEALCDLEEAVEHGRRLGDFHSICGALVNLGLAYREAGRDDQALDVLNEAFQRCEKGDAFVLQARASRALMGLHEAHARFSEALKYAQTVLRLQEGVHAAQMSRRTQVQLVEFEIDRLRSQAELERQKSEVLQESNQLLHSLQENLQHEATHDALTGLYNRRYFLQLLELTLAAAQTSGTRFAIAYLDLDGFKAVNDTYGHHVGDALLTEIARRAISAVRAEDVVARLGGDEFAIILKDLQRADDAKRQALRLARAIQGSFVWNEIQLQCQVSVGVSTFPEAGHTASELLQEADSEMYLRKRRRRALSKG